jgi:hypothetical protein
MTQAFNLAQFANKLNTSGATDNTGLQNSTISGVALGSNLNALTIGTGLSGSSYNGSSAVTIANSGVTSVTAGSGITVSASTGGVTITNSSPGAVSSVNGQTGAIVTTNLYSIGSFITGRPQNGTTYNSDATVAGSSLYAAGPHLYWSTDSEYFPSTWLNGTNDGPNGNSVSFVNTGTWRCVVRTNVNAGQNFLGMWVRIS